MIEITVLAKSGGPLTKRIYLSSDGMLVSDGSACVMSRGSARRLVMNGLSEFGSFIQTMQPNDAIALGAIREDLGDCLDVTTQDRLAKLNGIAPHTLIARTADHITYRAGFEALALIDIDTKGMPPDVHARIKEIGGFWKALVSVLPALDTTARMDRKSTSTGISRTDTGQALRGSNGVHVYLLVRDGADVDRFLHTLHERCWLAGFGWHMVGAGGQLLERSLVDRMVGMPERLVFEGAPVLVAPLVQNQSSRQPTVHDGEAIDSREACPPLRIVERAQLDDLRSRSAHKLAPERAKAREHFIGEHAARLAERTSLPPQAARRIIERQCEGFLLPDVVLPWDDDEFSGRTVADVLADPARFAGATLSDPLEGVIYGRTKALVMRRANGSPWIHSFAHGRMAYELRYDARAFAALLAKETDDEVVNLFARIMPHADLNKSEAEALRNDVSKRSGIGRRTLDNHLKQEAEQSAKALAREERDQRTAERQDTRPQIQAPPIDAPWLPQIEVLNDVLGSSTALEPPMRDIDGAIAQIRVRRVPNMHLLTNKGANEGEPEESRLPAPEQPLIFRPDEIQLAEIIERHIDYVDPKGRPVHLAAPFVKHFRVRDDGVLPTVAAIATLPIVLKDGTLLSKPGLDRERGIVFRVPQELCVILPRASDCTDAAVFDAMTFLVDEWLADVAADYTGKLVLLAMAMTVIERTLLNERPAFFVTAGRRGGGKTTTLIMLLMAVTGVRPSAAAWSTGDEERRKALLSHLMEGPPAIVWDNIVRGTQISCPHIEKACTSAFYSDRRLGVTEMVSVAASPIHCFTGNNIGSKGDLASRSLTIRLEVDRADPENRTFKHPDPIEWTEANRGKILGALYTILLANPAIRPGSNRQPQTRFKDWWILVGSALEYAAVVHRDQMHERVESLLMDKPAYTPVAINFRDLFLQQEEDDEENAGLADALVAMKTEWPNRKKFVAADLAKVMGKVGSSYISDEEKERAETIREFLYPDVAAGQTITAKSVGMRLKKRLGEPVRVEKETLCLKMEVDSHTKAPTYWVQVT